MLQCGKTKSVYRHKVWRVLPEKKPGTVLIPGLGFATVDQTPQTQLRSIKTRTNLVRDDAASCFCCTIAQQSPDPPLGAVSCRCCYGWRSLAPCRALTVAPMLLLAHAPGQRARLGPHISPEQPHGSFLVHRNAEELRGVTCTQCSSLGNEASFPCTS